MSSLSALEKANVLYLNSYHIDYYWTRDITEGINAIFDTVDNVHVYYEFLDTRNFIDTTYQNILFELLYHKYRDIPIEVIICSDNSALDFVLEHRDTSFFKAKLVYCGIYNIEDYYYPHDSIYGVKENIVLGKSITSIIELVPHVRTIYAVFDRTSTGDTYKTSLDSIKKSMRNIVDIQYIRDVDITAIEEVFGNIAPPDYVRYIGINYDNNNQRIDPEYIAKEIAKYCPGPVFGNPIANSKAKLVGGITVLGYDQGINAARIAYKILQKEPTESIPRLSIPDGRFCIDYQVAQKHNILLKKLPPNTYYLNKPEKFLKKYRIEAISLLSLMLVLTLIIASLISNNYKRRNYEKQLIKAMEKAEESDKLKSAFLTNMSHEIRTPLNAILGFANLLYEEKPSDEEFQQYIAYINTSARSLQNLIGEILDISKIETGQLQITKEEFDITNLLVEFYYTFQSPNTLRNNQLVCLNKKDTQILVYMDFYRLKQIITNLIENALNYTDNGVIQYGCIVNNSDVLCYVKDNGIGIPEKYQHKIFERFIKIEDDTKKLQGGTGLGLAISRQLSNLLDGELWVESLPGMGSLFTLKLNNALLSESEIQTNKGHSSNVLKTKSDLIIADKCNESYKYIKGIFNNKWNIERAVKVNELVDKISKNKPDWVLLDYQLIYNNIEFYLEHIAKHINPQRIILQTPFDKSKVERDDLFYAILEKPYNCDELFEIMLSKS